MKMCYYILFLVEYLCIIEYSQGFSLFNKKKCACLTLQASRLTEQTVAGFLQNFQTFSYVTYKT